MCFASDQGIIICLRIRYFHSERASDECPKPIPVDGWNSMVLLFLSVRLFQGSPDDHELCHALA
jgi:hypothetical protein